MFLSKEVLEHNQDIWETGLNLYKREIHVKKYINIIKLIIIRIFSKINNFQKLNQFRNRINKSLKMIKYMQMKSTYKVINYRKAHREKV